MKRFVLDTFLCSLFIFGLIGVFSSVTYFRVFDLFDPVGDMFSDFEMSDLVMSQLREPPLADDNIVIVNIAHSNREAIGVMIQILEQYDPDVIGVDVTFAEPKPYAADSLFAATLERYDNVIIGSELRLPNDETGLFDTLVVPEPILAKHADFGFVNLITDAADQNDVKTNRDFLVRHRVKDMAEEQYAFAVKLAAYKDAVLTKKFLARDRQIEVVNYKGNVMDYGQSTFGTRYFVLDIHEVFNESFSEDLLKDKVIIMCFLGAYLGDQTTREDLYFTPLNANYVGKAEPDMFGGVIHANIISMILEEDYIDQMSPRLGIALAILICLFNVFLFKIIYGALPRWYDGITKLFQLVQVLILVFIMIWLFSSFNYKADFTLAIIIVALSGDSIEVYHGVIKNLFSRKERRSLLKINREFWKES